MKALITGTTGQLGTELIRQVADYSFEAVPISEDELDITDLYNGWRAGNFPNYGLQLRPTSNNHEFNEFYSSDYSDDPYLRPKLVITP